MEVLICGGCQGAVPEVPASPHWLSAKVLSILHVGDGLGRDLSIRRAVTGCSKAYPVTNYVWEGGEGWDATQVHEASWAAPAAMHLSMLKKH